MKELLCGYLGIFIIRSPEFFYQMFIPHVWIAISEA